MECAEQRWCQLMKKALDWGRSLIVVQQSAYAQHTRTILCCGYTTKILVNSRQGLGATACAERRDRTGLKEGFSSAYLHTTIYQEEQAWPMLLTSTCMVINDPLWKVFMFDILMKKLVSIVWTTVQLLLESLSLKNIYGNDNLIQMLVGPLGWGSSNHQNFSYSELHKLSEEESS